RPPLEEMTLRQLRRVASAYGVSRYSRMRKAQLLAEIQKIQHTKISTSPSHTVEAQSEVEASKFELGQEDRTGGTLASVDEGLADLPGGYGESRIVLMPRDPQWAYTYWDIPNDHKEDLRRQGGQQLALRIYDVTDINLDYQSPHSIQEYPCDELAREWYLPIPVSDRDYVVDIGYRCADGRWLVLARSKPVHVPPVYPSDWIEDHFLTVNWEEDLCGKTVYELVPPSKRMPVAAAANPIYDEIFGMAKSAEAQRVAGSLFGSMQHVPGSMVPQQAVSSYIFPSGVGMWAVPTMSAVGMSGVGMYMSGVGFSASAVPIRPRQFWLVADAELIVYGATEPDATVTIGGRPIKLNPDGTFRFQMSFQDGLIDYPIMAVASDGEQTRSIHMKFNRETPSRHTNTKEEAVQEWLV
ncbi:MAG TPA: Rho termination protein, partial [Cyanobacteria bacterium UBA9273]|nr:Rho termination protein [Cyanobacteria bacterium UBA9273]